MWSKQGWTVKSTRGVVLRSKQEGGLIVARVKRELRDYEVNWVYCAVNAK